MTRRERNPLLALVVFLGLGLITAAYAVWALESQVKGNQELLRQQQRTVAALLDRDAENTRALQEQQRLVRALSRQVRQLGGTPVTLPETPTARPPGPPSNGGTPNQMPTPRVTSPSPTAIPKPSPTPTQHPAPRPSPSPTCLVNVGRFCL